MELGKQQLRASVCMHRASTLCIFKAVILSTDTGTALLPRRLLEELNTTLYSAVLLCHNLRFMYVFFKEGKGRLRFQIQHVLAKLQGLQAEVPSLSHNFFCFHHL